MVDVLPWMVADMSNLDDMVSKAYAEARQVAVVKQNPSRRTWFINGREYTDLDLRDIGIGNPRDMTEHQLSMLQLMGTATISRREAMERMVYTDPVRFT